MSTHEEINWLKAAAVITITPSRVNCYQCLLTLQPSKPFRCSSLRQACGSSPIFNDCVVPCRSRQHNLLLASHLTRKYYSHSRTGACNVYVIFPRNFFLIRRVYLPPRRFWYYCSTTIFCCFLIRSCGSISSQIKFQRRNSNNIEFPTINPIEKSSLQYCWPVFQYCVN